MPRSTYHDPSWDELGSRPSPSWYLDPLVARQKRDLHQRLIRRWIGKRSFHRVLKTDIFEEAHGEDQILFDLFSEQRCLVGIDVARTTVHRAAARGLHRGFLFGVADTRDLPFGDGSFDLVLSPSTLDHFESRAEYVQALSEIARIVRPDGCLILTLDNPRNPLYSLLRWFTRRRHAPFRLGYTASLDQLCIDLARLGFEIEARDTLIHNPRLVSTVLFRGLRLLLGSHADKPVSWFLRGFAQLDRWPSRWRTGCFIAVCARRMAGAKAEQARTEVQISLGTASVQNRPLSQPCQSDG